MNRRRWLAVVAAVAGCTGRSDTCAVPDALSATVPPAPDGYERVGTDRGSDASRAAFGASELLVVEYRDSDDETLDDYTFRAIHFREATDGERLLRDQLASIATDSGRDGVAVSLDGVGVLALGPSTDAARSLVTASPELSATCVERGRVATPDGLE